MTTRRFKDLQPATRRSIYINGGIAAVVIAGLLALWIASTSPMDKAQFDRQVKDAGTIPTEFAYDAAVRICEQAARGEFSQDWEALARNLAFTGSGADFEMKNLEETRIDMEGKYLQTGQLQPKLVDLTLLTC